MPVLVVEPTQKQFIQCDPLISTKAGGRELAFSEERRFKMALRH